MILTLLDRLGTQDAIEVTATGMLIRPLLDCVEHVAMDLNVLVAESGVMEGTDNIVDNFIYGYTRILPGV